MHRPEIAIIEPNTLTALGLKGLIQQIIPPAVIRTFSDFGHFTDDTPDMYAHYFISAKIYVEHNAFFLTRRSKTIVLVGGEVQTPMTGVFTLNLLLPEEELVREILKLHQHGHAHHHPHVAARPASELSPREVEVLVLLTRGLINKEIADRLNISLTTVITHRKNITEKLGIKSLSGLTIYAVLNGYVEADRI